MKKLTKPTAEYESPLVESTQLVIEGVCLTASGSSDSILDDMTENGGEWAGL